MRESSASLCERLTGQGAALPASEGRVAHKLLSADPRISEEVGDSYLILGRLDAVQEALGRRC